MFKEINVPKYTFTIHTTIIHFFIYDFLTNIYYKKTIPTKSATSIPYPNDCQSIEPPPISIGSASSSGVAHAYPIENNIQPHSKSYYKNGIKIPNASENTSKIHHQTNRT